MDYAFLNLAVTFVLLFAGFLLRRRIVTALGRLLFDGLIEFARAEFFEEGISVGEDGQKRPYVVLRPRGEAFLGAVVPPLVKAAVKGLKIRPGTVPAGLAPGIDLSNLAEALPAILPMLPKKYQGIAALLAPFAAQFLGTAKKGGEGASGTKREGTPFLK